MRAEVGAGAPSLSPRALRVARVIAARLFDGGAGVPEGRLDRFVSEVSMWSRFAGPQARMGLRLAIVAVQFLPLYTLRRPRRFTALSPEEQTRHLLSMEHVGLLSPAIAGLKMVFSIMWFEHPEDADVPALTRRVRS